MFNQYHIVHLIFALIKMLQKIKTDIILNEPFYC